MKILTIPQSGSVAGQTSSRNRFGQYIRSRATPVNPGSTFQTSVRARMTQNAQAWRLLTAAQRAGWEDLGLQISRNGSLGESYTMNGFMAYCSLNNNRLAAGDAVISDAPILSEPAPLVTLTVTLGAASYSVAYTVTPLAADSRLFVYASPQRSAGRTFEGDTRLISVTAAAAASPANVLAAYTARFGAPVVGNRIFTSAAVYNGGFMSAPLLSSDIVA